jgi:hypothetical protein
MTDQSVDVRSVGASTVAVWAFACLGAAAIVLFSVMSVVGLLFSVGLSEEPPNGIIAWGATLLVLLAFAGLPPLVGYGVARVARRRVSGAALACLVLWSVPLTTLICWGVFWVI